MRTARVTGRVAGWSYQNLVALYITLVVYTNLALSVDYKLGSGYAPFFDMMVLGLAVPLAMAHTDKWLPFMRTQYFKWAAFLAAVYVINFLRMQYGGYFASQVDLIEETNRVQRVLLWPFIGFIVYTVDPRFFRTGFYIALIAMPALVVVDFLDPFVLGPPDEVMDARAQGTYMNANVACEAIILLGILNLWRFRGLTGVVLVGIMSVGILLTFSRSGIAAMVLFGGYLYLRGRLPKSVIVIPIVLVISLSTILVYAEDILLDLGYDSSVANVLQRLAFFDAGDGGLAAATDESAEGRTQIAQEVFMHMLTDPIEGNVYDAKSAYGFNPHNQPLHFWFKFGILGLLAWLSMVFLLFRRGYITGLWYVSPAAIAFLWFSMFSHNILDFRFWIVFFAFILLNPAEVWHGSLGMTGRLSGTARPARNGRRGGPQSGGARPGGVRPGVARRPAQSARVSRPDTAPPVYDPASEQVTKVAPERAFGDRLPSEDGRPARPLRF